jgi:intracellular sulfur oxidation DsrE/DsrF family protein
MGVRKIPAKMAKPWREDKMKRFWIGGAALALLTALSGSALAQAEQSLPIPDGQVAKDIPGAKELPDPKMTYKVVFDIASAAPKIEEVNPGLTGVVRYLNTLAKNGVPADHRKIAVVLHQKATEIILNNEAFRARNDGHDNPNISLIQSMKKAGIDFRVCGQSVLANKIDPKTILPEIQLDLWALTTLVNLELRGYVHVGGN